MFLVRRLAAAAPKHILNNQSMLQASLKYSFSNFKGNQHNQRINELIVAKEKCQFSSRDSKGLLICKYKNESVKIELSSTLIQRDFSNDFIIEQVVTSSQIQAKIDCTRKIEITRGEVIKRELKNDSIQLPLKALAYFMAPVNLQPTFYAELIRSCIDSLNHLVLYGMNYVKMGPNEKYPYGIEKLKNIVVLIPSILFVYLGSEILVESATSFIDSHEEVSSHFSLTSTLLYLVSIGVEMNVIFNNIKDALKLDGDDVTQEKMTIPEIFKKLINKKDPLLQAILYENAITFLSTSVPMLCSSIHLFKTNVQQLIGEQQIDKESLDRIIHIARSNSLLKDISEVRAVKYGSEKFRLSAKIEFDMKKLTYKVTSNSEQNLQKVLKANSNIYSQEKRQESFTKSAANLVLSELMKEIQNQINLIQDSIQNEYPNCEHIDLEITHQDQQEEEYITSALEDINLKYDIDQGDSTDQISTEFREFVFQSTNRILKKCQARKNKLKIDKASQDYLQSEDYLDNQFEEDLLEEFSLFLDEQRFDAFPEFIKNDNTKQI